MNKNNKKLIIFDFDGTIANTWELMISIANEFSQKHGLPELVPEDHETLRDASLRAVASYFGVSKYKIPFIFKFAQRELYRRANELKPIAGIPKVIRKLKEDNYELAILTTNIPKTVKHFLEQHDLDVFGSVNTTGRGYRKAWAIKKIMKKHGYKPADTVHVGDTKNDIAVSQKVHVPAIAVTWGLNSRKSLEKENPLYIAETPDELFDILTTL